MKTVVGVFAHPDDEAVGPSGTLAKLAKENTVYLICVTNGEFNCVTGRQDETLGNIRKKELENSAKVLGIKKVFFLEFSDGTLCNNIYCILEKKIQEKLQQLKPELLLTFEPHGWSGHIDHITVSMITSNLFKYNVFIKEVWYYCIDENQYEKLGDFVKNYFIYFPPGYKKSDIGKTIDISEFWKTKLQAMYQHKSQYQDVKNVIKGLEQAPKEEYFFVKTR